MGRDGRTARLTSTTHTPRNISSITTMLLTPNRAGREAQGEKAETTRGH